MPCQRRLSRPGSWNQGLERHMDPLQQRIRSVRGHLRCIARLIERDAADLEAVRQIRAVQAALHAVRLLLLRRHLASLINNPDLASADPDAPALLELRALLISFLPSSASRSRPGLARARIARSDGDGTQPQAPTRPGWQAETGRTARCSQRRCARDPNGWKAGIDDAPGATQQHARHTGPAG